MADKDIATEDLDVPQEVEVNTETSVAEDKRKRTLTEKGQELHNEKLKKLQRKFDKTYEKWKVLAKVARKALALPSTSHALHQHQIKIHTADTEVKERYEDFRKHSVPDTDTCRRADTCDAVSRQLIEWLNVMLQEDPDQHLPTVQAPWGKPGSVFSCKEDQVSMLSRPGSGCVSRCSSQSSTRKQEAEAELAATKATLKVLAEMEQEEKELERLEAENRRKLAQQMAENAERLAQQEAENAERHRLLEEKRRQLELCQCQSLQSLAEIHSDTRIGKCHSKP